MLGSSVQRQLMISSSIYNPPFRFEWNSPSAVMVQLDAAVSEFHARTEGGKWAVYWCAGKGTMSSSSIELSQEIATISSFLECLKVRFGNQIEDGNLFFSSSVGGVYAGSTDQVINANTEPVSVNAYGDQKLLAESMFIDFAFTNKCRAVIGRLSNLYGTAQNRTKRQGLLTEICRSAILRNELNLFVGLDTVRNFLYVDDAARVIVDLIEEVASIKGGHVQEEIIASPRNHSISSVLKEFESVWGDRVVFSSSKHIDQARFPTNLAVRPRQYDSFSSFEFTPLGVGFGIILRDMLSRHQAGNLKINV
jgi:UDP-glucose 4-epimerase